MISQNNLIHGFHYRGTSGNVFRSSQLTGLCSYKVCVFVDLSEVFCQD